MLASLQDFTERLDQLNRSLEEAEFVDRLSALDLRGCGDLALLQELEPKLSRLLAGKTNRRVYTYASCIVLLYGLFEQFVESLLMAYVDALGRLAPTFADLPAQLRVSHDQVSARLILNLDQEKYRHRTTAAEVSRRVLSCYEGAPFRLNSLGYIDHSANLRIDTVNSLFSDAGLSGFSKKALRTRALSTYADSRFPRGVDRIPDEVAFEELLTLVERRNVIAHGWPDDILSVAYMKDLAAFVRQLGEAFHEVCRLSVADFSLRHRGAKALPAPLAVYNNSIVCFRIHEGVLTCGMHIVARNGRGEIREGEILELQVDHVPRDTVVAPPMVDVGCRVNIKAKMQYEYLLLES